jgi:transposase
VVDTNCLPVRIALTAEEAHDNRLADKLLSRLESGSMLLADRGYDADWIKALAARKGAIASRRGIGQRKLNESEVVRRQLVIARCDPAAVLDFVEKPFDQISGSIKIWAEADRLAASIRLWLRVPD